MNAAIDIVPSPLVRAHRVSRALGLEVWVKRDSDCHAHYGGSKARKLARILPHAFSMGATDLITVGSAGSNHLLSTAVHGAALGLRLHALVTPHPDSPATRATLAALVDLGVALYPVRGDGHILWTMARLRRRLGRRGRSPFVIAPGGSSAAGMAGIMDGFDELAAQLDGAAMPWPQWIICAVGSAGLVAGLSAAAHRHRAPTRIIGVKVRDGLATRWPYAWAMMQRALGGSARARGRPTIIDGRGPGYGRPDSAGCAMVRLFQRDGIELDDTYTAKAAACGLAAARARGIRTVLMWSSYARPPTSPGTLPRGLDHLLL